MTATVDNTLYDVGDLVRIRYEARTNLEEVSPQGELIDPTGLTLRIKNPDETILTFDLSESPTVIVRDSLGMYYYDHTAAQEGRHYYLWTSTGNLIDSEEGTFKVKDSQFF